MVKPGDTIYAYEFALTFVEHPLYKDAHPGEDAGEGELCTQCAWATRPDTGERVMLWLCGGIEWVVSRESPNWERHREEFHRETTEAPAPEVDRCCALC